MKRKAKPQTGFELYKTALKGQVLERGLCKLDEHTNAKRMTEMRRVQRGACTIYLHGTFSAELYQHRQKFSVEAKTKYGVDLTVPDSVVLPFRRVQPRS